MGNSAGNRGSQRRGVADGALQGDREEEKQKESMRDLTAWWNTAGPTAAAEGEETAEVARRAFEAGYCTVSILAAASEAELRDFPSASDCYGGVAVGRSGHAIKNSVNLGES